MIPGAQGQSREPRRTRAASRPGGGCAGVPAGRRRRRAEPSEVDDRVRPARAAASPNASAAPHRCAEVRVAQRVHEVAGASQPARGVLKVAGSCTSPWMVCWRRGSSRGGVLSLLRRGRSRPGPGTVGWPRSRRRRPRAPSPRPLNISASVTGVAGQQPGPHGARDLRRGAAPARASGVRWARAVSCVVRGSRLPGRVAARTTRSGCLASTVRVSSSTGVLIPR